MLTINYFLLREFFGTQYDLLISFNTIHPACSFWYHSFCLLRRRCFLSSSWQSLSITVVTVSSLSSHTYVKVASGTWCKTPFRWMIS